MRFLFRKKIKFGEMFGVQVGSLVGQMLFFVKKKKNDYGFLSIPAMENVWISEKDIDEGIKFGIIEKITYDSEEVRTVAKAQFEQNEKLVQLQPPS